MKINNPENFKFLPDAVLLDTDNTLYEYEPAHKNAIQALKKKFIQTFFISAKDFDRTYNQARNEVHSNLLGKGSSHSRLLYIKRMLELLGLGSQVLMALDFEQAYWRTFLSNATLFDESRDFLDDLRLHKIPICIVTDLTAQLQFRKMVYFGLENHFDFIVTSEESGHDKPHNASFNLALEKMNAIGKRVWMIGDSLDNDIAGAKNAINAITIQKIHSGVKKEGKISITDAEFNRYKDLRALIKKISKNAR